MSKGEGSCALDSGCDGAGVGGALWGKTVATVPPRGNMAAGVAADAPGRVRLGKTGLIMSGSKLHDIASRAQVIPKSSRLSFRLNPRTGASYRAVEQARSDQGKEPGPQGD